MPREFPFLDEVRELNERDGRNENAVAGGLRVFQSLQRWSGDLLGVEEELNGRVRVGENVAHFAGSGKSRGKFAHVSRRASSNSSSVGVLMPRCSNMPITL